jgi:hypothetical protein
VGGLVPHVLAGLASRGGGLQLCLDRRGLDPDLPAPLPTTLPPRAEEDGRLLELVRRFGAQNWTVIARHLGGGRNGKSCRLRWFNQLDPRVNKDPFTEDEVGGD